MDASELVFLIPWTCFLCAGLMLYASAGRAASAESRERFERQAERAKKYILEVEYADGRRETVAERAAPMNAKRRAAMAHVVREFESA